VSVAIDPAIIELIILGWLLTLASSVVDALDRRSHRKDIYDLLKVNLAYQQERYVADSTKETRTA